jgi:hypothetical protein
VEGAYAEFSRDPYVKVPSNRRPSTESVDVLIVGGGIAGLLTAVELRRSGVASFQIIEKGSDFGGTWYRNRYPGIACDCESLIYIPLLEELGYTPSVKYAPGEEIGAHLCPCRSRRVGTTSSRCLVMPRSGSISIGLCMCIRCSSRRCGSPAGGDA